MEQMWRDLLSEKVVSIYKEKNVREADCEPLVKCWVREIAPTSRPTVTGVIATAQRKIWNCEPID